MTGPNTGLYETLSRRYPALEIQASGGVGKLEDLKRLRKSEVSAVIVGKALYEGKLTLKEALQC